MIQLNNRYMVNKTGGRFSSGAGVKWSWRKVKWPSGYVILDLNELKIYFNFANVFDNIYSGHLSLRVFFLAFSFNWFETRQKKNEFKILFIKITIFGQGKKECTTILIFEIIENKFSFHQKRISEQTSHVLSKLRWEM